MGTSGSLCTQELYSLSLSFPISIVRSYMGLAFRSLSEALSGDDW